MSSSTAHETCAFFGAKTENLKRYGVFRIVGSRNILIAGLGGHNQIEQGRSLIHVEDSSDVVVAVAGLSENNPQGATVFEKIGEGKPLTISQDHSLALYKRGEVNDAAWERTPLAQVRNGEKSLP